jgi:hypothetical protein
VSTFFRHTRNAARPARRIGSVWPSVGPSGQWLGRIKEATSHRLLWSSGSGAGSRVTSTICRSTRSITRRMVSSSMPPSGSVTATFVGMSSPSSRASRASSLMSASVFFRAFGDPLWRFRASPGEDTPEDSATLKRRGHRPAAPVAEGCEPAWSEGPCCLTSVVEH